MSACKNHFCEIFLNRIFPFVQDSSQVADEVYASPHPSAVDRDIERTLQLSPKQLHQAVEEGPINMANIDEPVAGANDIFSSDESSDSEVEEVTTATRPLGGSSVLRVGGPIREPVDVQEQTPAGNGGQTGKKVISVRTYQERRSRAPVTIPLGAPVDPRLNRYTIPRRTDSAPPATGAPGV